MMIQSQPYWVDYPETQITESPFLLAGWVLLSMWLEDQSFTRDHSYYENGYNKTTSIVVPHTVAKFLLGRKRDDVLEAALKKSAEDNSALADAGDVVRKTSAECQALKSELSSVKARDLQKDDLLANYRKRVEESASMQRKLEGDLAKVAKDIGDSRMREILSEKKTP